MFDKSIQDKEDYWRQEAEDLQWFKKPSVILDQSEVNAPRWYPDGELNVCYNCLDRHVNNGKGERPALYSVCGYTGEEVTFTYAEMLENVGKLGTVLKEVF